MCSLMCTHTLNIYLNKIVADLENFLLVDEDKTPEQIMQEKQMELYVIF